MMAEAAAGVQVARLTATKIFMRRISIVVDLLR
jgi:hypothetical protein